MHVYLVKYALLKITKPLAELRGQVHQYKNIPLVATYDLIHLLNNPRDKSKTYQDLLLIRRTFSL